MESDVKAAEGTETIEVKERKKPGPKPKAKPIEEAAEGEKSAHPDVSVSDGVTSDKSAESEDEVKEVIEASKTTPADSQPSSVGIHLPVGSIVATHGRTIVIHKYANLSDIGTRHSGVVRVVENNDGVCYVRYMVSGFGPCMGHIHENKLNKYMK